MPTQNVLFDREGLVEVPRARRDGPSTSVEAARAARGFAHAHRQVILAALARAGVASAEDLEQRLGGAIPAIGIMKRLVDLVDAGIVRVHDEDGRTRSGRRCRRYRLADEVRT